MSAFRTVAGEGKPRLILEEPTNIWASVGAVNYGTSGDLYETPGSNITISTSANASGNVSFDTATAHGLNVGDLVKISGHSVAAYNGFWHVVTRPDTDTFTIDCEYTSAGTGGTSQWVPDFSRVVAGMRVVVTHVVSSIAAFYYGRVTSVDQSNNRIDVDSWINGEPVNGDTFVVNGWVSDLPYCQQLVETFSPRQLLHPLFRGRKEEEFYGYDYRAELSWAQYLSADDLYTLNRFMNRRALDDLIFVPRIDEPRYQYRVVIAGPSALALFGVAGGHSRFTLTLEGKELVLFPIVASGYGFNYATLYGTGL